MEQRKYFLKDLTVGFANGRFILAAMNQTRTAATAVVDITDQVAEVMLKVIQHNPMRLTDGESFYDLTCTKLSEEETAKVKEEFKALTPEALADMAGLKAAPADAQAEAPKSGLIVPERKIILPD